MLGHKGNFRLERVCRGREVDRLAHQGQREQFDAPGVASGPHYLFLLSVVWVCEVNRGGEGFVVGVGGGKSRFREGL